MTRHDTEAVHHAEWQKSAIPSAFPGLRVAQIRARRAGWQLGWPAQITAWRGSRPLVERTMWSNGDVRGDAPRVGTPKYRHDQSRTPRSVASEASVKRPCTPCRSRHSGLTTVVNSGRAVPSSPREVGLRLLPSGPDRVRRSPPRGTLPSTSRIAASPETPDLEREFNPAKAGCGFRAPPAPHLARSAAQYTRRPTPTP